MKKTYINPICTIVLIGNQLPLAGSGYTVNGFTESHEETLGGDAPSGSNVKTNPVDWGE